MDLLRKPKLEELREAIRNRLNHVIVLYGPPGSLKTTATSQVCSQLGLSLEYSPDISNYKGRLLNKNQICFTDIDSHEYISKHKNKIERMKNLIIETRSLQNIWKYVRNCKIIEFRKICKSTVKKMLVNERDPVKLEKALEAIDGNLHKFTFYNYCFKLESIDIYRYLGRLFYSKNLSDSPFNRFKITNYLFNNAIHFIQEEDIYEVYDGFSLTDSKLDEFYCYSEYLVYKSNKKNLGKFLFKSTSLDETHYCSSLCKEFRNTK